MPFNTSLHYLLGLIRRRRIHTWKKLEVISRHRKTLLRDYLKSKGGLEKVELLLEENSKLRARRTEEQLKRQMIRNLIRLSHMLHFSPGRKEIDDDGTYTSSAYVYHFGSIRNAQVLANLLPNQDGGGGHKKVRPRYSLAVTQ